jgi:ribose transport system substrate-binding protein
VSGSSGAIVQQAKQIVDSAENGLWRPPAKGASAQRGKNIWYVACGFAANACLTTGQQVQEAGTSLGWTVHLADGKLTPAGYTAAIEQAIAAKPDGIITDAIDCVQAQGAFQKAKDAGIPVLGASGFDCNDPGGGNGGPSLFYTTNYGTGSDLGKWWYNWGVLHAAYLIAATNGNARVLAFNNSDFTLVRYEQQGFKAEMAKCTACTIVNTTNVSAPDLGNGRGVTEIQSAIQTYQGKINSIFFDVDAMTELAAQTLRSNPALKKMTIVAGEAYAPTISLLRQGYIDALVPLSQTWLGWCAADAMNSILAKQPIADCGLDFGTMTQGSSMLAGQKPNQDFVPPMDFTSDFKKNWVS